MKRIVIYDPTKTDSQSKVRGVGRYILTLRETFGDEWLFTSDLSQVTENDIFLNPFFDPIKPPIKLPHKPYKQVVIIHDLIPLLYKDHFPVGLRGKWYEFLNKRTLSHVDLIITDSETSKKSIIALLKIPAQKIEVVYATVPHLFLPHVDQSDTHHPFHTEQGHSVAEFSKVSLDSNALNPALKDITNFILYVGDATWNKNLINMAVAVQMANITCICVGKVFNSDTILKNPAQKPHPWQIPLYQFMNYTKEDKRFIFPGYISDIDLLALYKRAKLNILVSHDEGFGLSYIESGYVGTPSILADRPIFHEIARRAALFANPLDAKDIAQKISELYYDKTLHQKMSIDSFNRVQDFSPHVFKKRWQEALGKYLL